MFSASKLLVSRAEVSVDVYLLTGATLLALAKFIYYLNGFKTTALEKKVLMPIFAASYLLVT